MDNLINIPMFFKQIKMAFFIFIILLYVLLLILMIFAPIRFTDSSSKFLFVFNNTGIIWRYQHLWQITATRKVNFLNISVTNTCCIITIRLS